MATSNIDWRSSAGRPAIAVACALILLCGGCGGGSGSIKGQIGALGGGGLQGATASPASKLVYTILRQSSNGMDLRSVNVDGSGDIALATGGYVFHFDALDASDKVAYTRAPDSFQLNQLDAATIDTAGAPGVNLSNNSSTDWSVKWSSDGSRIYFMRSYMSGDEAKRDVFRANSDGSSEVNITNNSTLEGWKSMYFEMSKDGTSIMYSAGQGIYSDKKIVRFDTAAASETALFAAAAGETAMGPYISPDGNTVAYFADCSSYTCKNLVFTDSNGTILRTTVNKSYNTRDIAGAWAPDSDRFAVRESRSVVVYKISANEKQTILAADNSTSYYVTDWSDDGSKLAGIKAVPYGNSSSLHNAIVFNPDGTGLFQATSYTTDEDYVYRVLFAR